MMYYMNSSYDGCQHKLTLHNLDNNTEELISSEQLMLTTLYIKSWKPHMTCKVTNILAIKPIHNSTHH